MTHAMTNVNNAKEEFSSIFSASAGTEMFRKFLKQIRINAGCEYLSALTYDTILGAYLYSIKQTQIRFRVFEQAENLPEKVLINVLTNVKAFDTMTPTNVITNVKTQFTNEILPRSSGKTTLSNNPTRKFTTYCESLLKTCNESGFGRIAVSG